jgi:hypothetical protein
MKWLRKVLGMRTEVATPPSDSPPELATTLLEAEGMAAELDGYLHGDPLLPAGLGGDTAGHS